MKKRLRQAAGRFAHIVPGFLRGAAAGGSRELSARGMLLAALGLTAAKLLLTSFQLLLVTPGGAVIDDSLMYNLAKALGTWNHPLLEGTYPPNPYPIEFVNVANWRTTAEKISLMEKNGFRDLTSAQTLTTHPLYSDLATEQPLPGHDRGDYVAVTGWKK